MNRVKLFYRPILVGSGKPAEPSELLDGLVVDVRTNGRSLLAGFDTVFECCLLALVAFVSRISKSRSVVRVSAFALLVVFAEDFGEHLPNGPLDALVEFPHILWTSSRVRSSSFAASKYRAASLLIVDPLG